MYLIPSDTMNTEKGSQEKDSMNSRRTWGNGTEGKHDGQHEIPTKGFVFQFKVGFLLLRNFVEVYFDENHSDVLDN